MAAVSQWLNEFRALLMVELQTQMAHIYNGKMKQ